MRQPKQPTVIFLPGRFGVLIRPDWWPDVSGFHFLGQETLILLSRRQSRSIRCLCHVIHGIFWTSFSGSFQIYLDQFRIFVRLIVDFDYRRGWHFAIINAFFICTCLFFISHDLFWLPPDLETMFLSTESLLVS